MKMGNGDREVCVVNNNPAFYGIQGKKLGTGFPLEFITPKAGWE
jgi:hypothetical protein